MKIIPKHLQPILWSSNVKKLDLEQNKIYIIHQVLAFGEISDIKWLFKVYPLDIIKNIFLHKPKRLYSKPVLNLVKNFILKLKDICINEKKYIKSIF